MCGQELDLILFEQDKEKFESVNWINAKISDIKLSDETLTFRVTEKNGSQYTVHYSEVILVATNHAIEEPITSTELRTVASENSDAIQICCDFELQPLPQDSEEPIWSTCLHYVFHTQNQQTLEIKGYLKSIIKEHPSLSERLMQMEDRELQKLLYQHRTEDIINCFISLPEELRNKILANVSKKRATMILEGATREIDEQCIQDSVETISSYLNIEDFVEKWWNSKGSS